MVLSVIVLPCQQLDCPCQPTFTVGCLANVIFAGQLCQQMFSNILCRGAHF